MAANSRFTTAVHALCWIELAARWGEAPLTSQRVAASLASNPVVVRRTLAPLREAGLVTVAGRGPGAGWSLGRPARDISLLEVRDALGPEPTFALHPHEPNLKCPVGGGIRPVLAGVYDEVDDAVARSLATRSVADVLDAIVAA